MHAAATVLYVNPTAVTIITIRWLGAVTCDALAGKDIFGRGKSGLLLIHIFSQKGLKIKANQRPGKYPCFKVLNKSLRGQMQSHNKPLFKPSVVGWN